jgi:hypothetical protein
MSNVPEVKYYQTVLTDTRLPCDDGTPDCLVTNERQRISLSFEQLNQFVVFGADENLVARFCRKNVDLVVKGENRGSFGISCCSGKKLFLRVVCLAPVGRPQVSETSKIIRACKYCK